ncbi:AI-2E family transporter [Desulfitispora alkaliphila]|uniref:AI-2E family transporter n=1 Tax=Desulfitispora alkaliphila TaxID=622674 RepID=UPI003D242E73
MIFISTLFFPVLISGILYYLTNPLVNLISSKRVPRSIAILLMYLVIAVFFVMVMMYLGPLIQMQALSLLENAPHLISNVHKQMIELQENIIFTRFQETGLLQKWETADYVEAVDNIIDTLVSNTAYLLNLFASVVLISITIPFITFYMLKDGHKLPEAIARFFPIRYKEETIEVLNQMGSTISTYIKGQLIVSLFVGSMVFIAFTIIGLEYSLILTLIATVTNFVPYFGPIIGTIPGMIVGFIDSPWTAVQVLVLVFIIQQLESQLVAPQVLGRKLKIHPVTIIFVLLTGGSLAGFLGMILAVPTYAVSKVVVTHLHTIIKLHIENEGLER